MNEFWQAETVQTCHPSMRSVFEVQETEKALLTGIGLKKTAKTSEPQVGRSTRKKLKLYPVVHAPSLRSICVRYTPYA